jgi:hypothetical protein
MASRVGKGHLAKIVNRKTKIVNSYSSIINHPGKRASYFLTRAVGKNRKL